MLHQCAFALGGVVAAALLAMGTAATAATVDLDYATFNRGKLAKAQADMADFKAALPPGFQAEGFEGYKPWGQGKGTQNLRHDRRRQLHAVRQDRRRQLGRRRRLQAAGARRQPHALGPLQRRRRRRAAARQLARQQRQPRHQVADQGRRQVQRHRLLRHRRRRRRRQVLDQGRRHRLPRHRRRREAQERQHPLRAHPARPRRWTS